MKKLIMTLTAAALLSSCAWQDKGGVGPERDNDKILSVEDAETSEVSALYEGYEELQGKQIGERIVMPEVITPQDIGNVYTFQIEDNFDLTNVEEQGKEFFKRFFGDEFNADRLYYYSNEEHPDVYPDLSYNPNDPDLSEDIYDPNDPRRGSYCGYPASALKMDVWTYWNPPKDNVIAVYDPVRDKDAVMELEGGSCTVGEICAAVTDFNKREFTGFEGMDIGISGVYYYTEKVDGEALRLANVRCCLEREGVPALDRGVSYSYSEDTADGGMDCYYWDTNACFTLDGKKDILAVRSDIAPQRVTTSSKLENVISLKTAAELLDENLAEKLLFKIDDVKLYYCRKVTSYSFIGEVDENGWIDFDQDKQINIYEDYHPVWIFWFLDGDGSLLVDAVSGEITLAADAVTLNKLRREQWK